MPTAMVCTRQKPPQRTRVGERPEGRSGSIKSVGGPDGSWGASLREATCKGGRRRCGGPIRSEYADTGEPVTRGVGGQADAACPGNMVRTCRIGPPMPPALQGRAQKAERHKGSRFRPLSGMLDEDVLQPCWRDLRKEAASGVDQGCAQASAQHLDERIHRRVARLTPQGYRATRGGWDHARAGRISAGNESVESDLS